VLVLIAAAWALSLGGNVPTPLGPAGFWAPYGGARGIMLIYIEGLITSGRTAGSMFEQATGSDDILAELNRAGNDRDVAAVVLRINSGGGSVAGSQEVAQAVTRLRQRGKVVVASMGDAGASGAYLLASAADAIVADPGTVTGSIGVIMSLTNMEELYAKLGIRDVTIKSGEHKDMGSAARELTAEERAILQEMVDDLHRQFVAAVAQGRGLPESQVAALADGRPFTGNQARELGLVDRLGNLDVALEVAADAAGLGDDFEVIQSEETEPLFDLLTRFLGQALFRVVPPGLWRGGDSGITPRA